MSHMGSALGSRARAPAGAHTDARLCSVFRQDGNLWERLPPCVRLGAAVALAGAGTSGWLAGYTGLSSSCTDRLDGPRGQT